MVLWLSDYSIKHDLSGSCSSSGPIASGTDLLHCVPVDFLTASCTDLLHCVPVDFSSCTDLLHCVPVDFPID